jgi:superkiller protein 3
MLRKLFFAVALVAALTWSGGAASQSEEPAAKAYLDAMEYVQKGNYSDALPLLQKVVSDSADFALGHYNLGFAYERLGAPDSARVAYEAALSLDSTLVIAHYSLATVALRSQDYPTAVEHLRKATELDSTFVAAYLNLGAALDQANDLDGAVTALNKAIQLKPDYVDAYYQLGSTQFRKAASAKDYPDVITTYKKALELGPAHANASVAHFYLARMYLATGQNEPAITSADEAIKLKPDLAQAYFVKGKALSTLGKDDAAIAAYKKAIEKNQNYGSAHHALGILYQKKEQWEFALKEYRAVAKDTTSPQAPAAAKAAKAIEDYLKKTAQQGQ